MEMSFDFFFFKGYAFITKKTKDVLSSKKHRSLGHVYECVGCSAVVSE